VQKLALRVDSLSTAVNELLKATGTPAKAVRKTAARKPIPKKPRAASPKATARK
jgi:hypothetical protein